MTPDKSNLPWTDEGRELLARIKRIIDRNGGNLRMARLIEKEAPEFFGKVIDKPNDSWYIVRGLDGFTEEQDNELRNLWETNTLEYISRKLKKNITAVYRRGLVLGLGKRSPHNIAKRISGILSRSIEATYNGKTLHFDSSAICAEYFKVDRSTISKALKKGYRVNGKYKLTFIKPKKNEKETINNSQAQKDKAHRYRQEVGTSHHANL